MYLCYIDETGNRDPRLRIPQKDGSEKDGDWLYVLTAVCIFEQRWHTLEKPINRRKHELMEALRNSTGQPLDLGDCEVKSNWLRQPKERARHPFLSGLNEQQLLDLVELYYSQLLVTNAQIFAVMVDKRHAPSGWTQQDIHVRSWERLLELIERFMRARHHRHQAIMINDDVSRETNRLLAMTHARLLDKGTQRDTWLRHICEMPMFVRSELSAGVQLADLCSYNIYRAFKTGDLAYRYFARIAPAIWSTHQRVGSGKRFSGLEVLDAPNSPLIPLIKTFEKQQALAHWDQGLS